VAESQGTRTCSSLHVHIMGPLTPYISVYISLLQWKPSGNARAVLGLVINLPSPGEHGYPVQNGIDEKANNGQEDEEDNDDDGDSNISFNHFATGLFRLWLIERVRRRSDTGGSMLG